LQFIALVLIDIELPVF